MGPSCTWCEKENCHTSLLHHHTYNLSIVIRIMIMMTDLEAEKTCRNSCKFWVVFLLPRLSINGESIARASGNPNLHANPEIRSWLGRYAEAARSARPHHARDPSPLWSVAAHFPSRVGVQRAFRSLARQELAAPRACGSPQWRSLQRPRPRRRRTCCYCSPMT